MHSPAAFLPPPPEEGVGSARPPPGLPPSPARPLRRGWWPIRNAVEAEKAPLNSGGRGPDPGVRQKSRPDRGQRGMVVARSGHAAHFPQPPPQFIEFRGERDCSRRPGGLPESRNAGVYLRRLLLFPHKPRLVVGTGGCVLSL